MLRGWSLAAHRQRWRLFLLFLLGWDDDRGRVHLGTGPTTKSKQQIRLKLAQQKQQLEVQGGLAKAGEGHSIPP
jgi:hypothetical protein